MPYFKINKNKKDSTDKMTIDGKHQEMITYFNNLKKNLVNIKKNFEEVDNKFNIFSNYINFYKENYPKHIFNKNIMYNSSNVNKIYESFDHKKFNNNNSDSDNDESENEDNIIDHLVKSKMFKDSRFNIKNDINNVCYDSDFDDDDDDDFVINNRNIINKNNINEINNSIINNVNELENEYNEIMSNLNNSDNSDDSLDENTTLKNKRTNVKFSNLLELNSYLLKKYNKEFKNKKIKSKDLESIILNSNITELYSYKNKLNKDIKKLKDDIYKIENKDEENNYYLENGDLLYSYFDNINTVKNKDINNNNSNDIDDNDNYDNNYNEEYGSDSDDELLNKKSKNKKDKKNISTKDISSFFGVSKKNINDDINDGINDDVTNGVDNGVDNGINDVNNDMTNDDINNGVNEVNNDVNINKLNNNIIDIDYNNVVENDYNNDNVNNDFSDQNENKIKNWVNQKSNFKKGELYQKFMSQVNPHFNIKLSSDMNTYKCDVCGGSSTSMNVYECIISCNTCGNMKYVEIDTDKRSYKDPPPEMTYFAYKRINHFREWIAQFQAKETTDIPDIVYTTIIMEIKKNRLNDMEQLKPSNVRSYLKKHKLNKYYEHIPHIIYKLNGMKPPVIPKEIEEKLCALFKDIQVPFAKVKPANRKNFLSYAFVIYKFCQLLELDDLAKNFILLKNREKLNQQEKIWKDICKELNWEYIPTIS